MDAKLRKKINEKIRETLENWYLKVWVEISDEAREDMSVVDSINKDAEDFGNSLQQYLFSVGYEIVEKDKIHLTREQAETLFFEGRIIGYCGTDKTLSDGDLFCKYVNTHFESILAEITKESK